MSDKADGERSREACPVCGAHQLQLLYFPEVEITGVRPYDDMFGFGDVKPERQPGIGCANCGTEWPDLASFRRAMDEQPESDS
jgi:hypothetical protein